MRALSWLTRRRACQVTTHSLGEWKVVEVRGKYFAGEPEEKLHREVDAALEGGARRLVVDLTRSHLSDESVAMAAPAIYHKGRSAGADVRFIVLPGRAGGYYHMAGLGLALPTYTRLGGAIEL